MEDERRNDLIEGRNAVNEAMRAGRAIDKLFVSRGSNDSALGRIISRAKERGIAVVTVDRRKLDEMSVTGSHQGVIAIAAVTSYATLDDILALAEQRGEDPFVVVCDEISDVHNLGAIIRSSECAGAHGVIIPERRAAGLTPACEKAAAGALAHLPVARVKNLNRALEELKRAGLWIVAAALEGENALTADLSGPLALVIGSEGEGISRLTLSLCDRRVTLPMLGKISSLNASVAAGILCYEVSRQRGGLKAVNP